MPVAKWSPPSRAAWIEIVDAVAADAATTSPPSRAAWIEMQLSIRQAALDDVAAFTGGVD